MLALAATTRRTMGTVNCVRSWPIVLLAVALLPACAGSDGAPSPPGDGGVSSGGAAGMANTGGASSGTGGVRNSGGDGSARAGGGGLSAGTGGADSSSGGAMATGMGGAVSAGGGAAAGGAASGSGGSGPNECTSASDSCPMQTGLTHACEKRFALGINYAWRNFSADFGGISAWGTKSVSQDPASIDADLGAMHAAGVSAVRWWVFPDFRGDGVTFDANGDPTGITATVKADVDKALELAEKNDVYLVLTIFSFDDFRPDQTQNGILVRGMSPMVSNAARRSKLLANVVRPLAHAAGGSAHAAHLLGWDVINEPEWAVLATGSAPGGQDFSPNTELTAVSLANMKALINETSAVLKSETPDSLTSVGWAAAKWAWAFKDVTGIDFDQPHIYGWVDQYWPYTHSPTELGYGSKPTVMGEFFLQSMPFSDGGDQATYADILASWWNDGYAGAWGWQYSEKKQNLPLIQAFKTAKGCPAGF